MFSMLPVDRSSSTRTWSPRRAAGVGQVGTDEAGAAGDEDSHATLLA